MPGRSFVAHRRGNLGKTCDPTPGSSFTVVELIGFPTTAQQGSAFVKASSLPAHHGCHAQLPNKRARHMPSTTEINTLDACARTTALCSARTSGLVSWEAILPGPQDCTARQRSISPTTYCSRDSEADTHSSCASTSTSIAPAAASAIPWISPVSVLHKRPVQQLEQATTSQQLFASKRMVYRRLPAGYAAHTQITMPRTWGCAARNHNVPAGSPLLPLLRVPGDSVHDVLGCAFKQLSFQEPSTLRLALHCFNRINQHPTLALALGATRVSYGIVTLWLAAKLEERRGGIIGSQRVAQVVGTTAKAVAAMELQIFQLLDWSPYRGYGAQDELLVFL